MFETVLIFAAGFLAASVLALMILPGVNARAGRLARRRLAAQFPISIDELTAQMDYVRAEGAIAVRKVERQLEKERAAHAQDRAGSGTVEAALRQQMMADASALASLRREHDASTQENVRLTAELDAMTEDRDARRITIAGLETRLASLTAGSAAQENALLRKRIAEVAERIAVLTGTEDAPAPPVEADTPDMPRKKASAG
ncbi:hypothetical protein ACFFJ7_07120 [Pseudochelatococcus lubricantis]|uniref:hypothetical protein n=1 Tax=Pseudochelatococcus lubricantis TaxID=1538102 RepID=UPI0035F0E08F